MLCICCTQVTGIFRAVPHRANPRMRSVKSIYKTYIGMYVWDTCVFLLFLKPINLSTFPQVLIYYSQ